MYDRYGFVNLLLQKLKNDLVGLMLLLTLLRKVSLPPSGLCVVYRLMIAFVGAVEEISDWNFRDQLEVNFFGTANIIRCVLPAMRRRRSGHIINVTGLSTCYKL